MKSFTSAFHPALKSLTAIVALALVTLGLSVISASPSVAQQSMAARWTTDRYEVRVQQLINKQRASRGLVALKTAQCATQTASGWSRHLAAADAFYHQDMGNVLSKCNASYAGETLGKGGISPSRLVQLWMESPAHKAVLISEHPQSIGVSAVVDSHGQWLTAANFVRL